MNINRLAMYEVRDDQGRDLWLMVSDYEIELIDSHGNPVAEYKTGVNCFDALATTH
jgi:hypothetical protein